MVVKKIALLGLKLETTPGVYNAPAGSDCNLLVTDPSFAVDQVSNPHEAADGYFGSLQDVPGGRSVTIGFRVPMKGSGTAGTAPAIGKALKCCSMAETIEAGIRSLYMPLTDPNNADTCSIKMFLDGKAFAGRGCAGTYTVSGKGNEIHYFEFEFTGVFEAETDEAKPTPSLEPSVPVSLLSAYLHLLEYNPDTLVESLPAVAGEGLEDATNQELAILINNTAATELKRVRLYLKQNGTPSGHTNGIRAKILADLAGDPDPATVIATSGWEEPTLVSASGEWVDFIFATPASLSAATPYWVYLEGDYTPSAVNYIEWMTNTVTAPGQLSKTYNGAVWAAVALENFMVQNLQAPKADIKFDGIEWDFGNAVELEPDVNDAEGNCIGFVGDRSVLSTLAPEEQLVADRDFISYQRNATRLMLCYQLGSAQGNIVKFHAPWTRITESGDEEDRNNLRVRPLALKCNKGVGDDEVELRFG